MQTEILEEFLAVARYSSFRCAAESLHVTQPALSKHISVLERELGFKLFDRTGATRLTAAGSSFYCGVQDVLDQLSRCVEDAKALVDQAPSVRLRCLGREDSAFYRFAPQVSTPFSATPMDDAQPAGSLLELDQADVLVLPLGALANLKESCSRRLSFVSVGSVEVAYMVSADNPAAARGYFTREELAKAEVLFPFGNLYGWIETAASSSRVAKFGLRFVQDPTVVLDSDHAPIKGLGTRIMSNYRGAARRAAERYPNLAVVESLEGEPFSTEEYLVYDPANPNPNVQAFVEEVRALAATAGRKAPGQEA